ncbi:ATP-binding cassette domain-containing protein, partial [candidate division KSB3 bacterium]|nr:ATP-binding cassette domain-containing protein [candidate division KSB3 bacterium]MBD3324965.1 ATP-binding cassette domain-containing protein [candidate division KSB3 bacterium]
SVLIESFPNYAISIIAFSGILMITIYLIAVKENFQDALPLIGLYAMAGYRFLPIVRNIYGSVTQIRYTLPTVDLLYQDLQGEVLEEGASPVTESIVPLPFEREIVLREIAFTYPNAQTPLFENVNLSIKANTNIGLVGATGCGKTTLVDIMLGLLTPQHGVMVVDGVEVTAENLRNWQRNVGYVPQHIFLSDDTIARNIAFGVPETDLVRDAVKKAARIANLHHFIMTELPHGYETVVGERGIRLSGGQRQRIGIARALYRDPSFLIFDEATSSLDNITEQVVMEAINSLSGQKTMVMIAHRLSTVKACDRIYVMEHGSIIAQGDYETLIHTSQEFQQMVTGGKGEKEKL